MCPSFKTCHRSPLLLYSQLPRPPSLSFCTGQAACSKSNLLLKKFFFGAVPQLFDTAVYIYTQQTPRPDLVSQYKEPCGLQGWLSYLRTAPLTQRHLGLPMPSRVSASRRAYQSAAA